MIGEVRARRRRAARPRRAALPAARAAGEPGRVREYTLDRRRPRDRDRAGRLLPGLDVQRHRPRPRAPRDRGRPAARPLPATPAAHPHTIHFHGIHPANMDGVFEIVEPGGELHLRVRGTARRAAPYHCHATPLKKHIHKGLYGALIIDPAEPRPPAQELVMVMNGYDTDGDGANNFYTVNGRTFYYAQLPDPGAALGDGAHLPREPDRVRPDQLVPPARATSSATSRRARATTGSTPTRSCSARASAA